MNQVPFGSGVYFLWFASSENLTYYCFGQGNRLLVPIRHRKVWLIPMPPRILHLILIVLVIPSIAVGDISKKCVRGSKSFRARQHKMVTSDREKVQERLKASATVSTQLPKSPLASFAMFPYPRICESARLSVPSAEPLYLFVSLQL